MVLTMVKELRLLNWNANGLRNIRYELLIYLQRKETDVACITEMHLTPESRFFLSGYTIYREDRTSCNKSSGGVALIIKKK